MSFGGVGIGGAPDFGCRFMRGFLARAVREKAVAFLADDRKRLSSRPALADDGALQVWRARI